MKMCRKLQYSKDNVPNERLPSHPKQCADYKKLMHNRLKSGDCHSD